MNSIKNRVQLIGNLGADPEMKTIENGNKMAKLRMATSESYTNKNGERVTDTEWHNVVAWGKTAELAEKLLKKGNEVLVEGKLTHRDFTGTDNVKRYYTEVVVLDFISLDKKQAATQ